MAAKRDFKHRKRQQADYEFDAVVARLQQARPHLPIPDEVYDVRDRAAGVRESLLRFDIGVAVDAVVSDDTDAAHDELLRACMMKLIDQEHAAIRSVRKQFDDRIGLAVEDLFTEAVRKAIYEEVAARFDAAADRMTAIVGKVDVDASDAGLAKMPKKHQELWLAVPETAAALDSLHTLLVDAATLRWSTFLPLDHGSQMALCLDIGKAHLRKTWGAFQSKTGRGGKWGALVKVGATLRAYDGDTPPKAVRQPRPPVAVMQPTGDGTARQVMVDPEDGPDAEARWHDAHARRSRAGWIQPS